MTSKCYETSMTYYDETFGGETYFICLTIVLFPDSPAPVRERESVLARWTHTQTFQIFPCSIKEYEDLTLNDPAFVASASSAKVLVVSTRSSGQKTYFL